MSILKWMTLSNQEMETRHIGRGRISAQLTVQRARGENCSRIERPNYQKSIAGTGNVVYCFLSRMLARKMRIVTSQISKRLYPCQCSIPESLMETGSLGIIRRNKAVLVRSIAAQSPVKALR